MSKEQIKSEEFLMPLLGSKIVCPKCYKKTLEVISVNGIPFKCRKDFGGCGKGMTIKEYCEFALKEVNFSFFQKIFPKLFKIVQEWR